MQSDGISLKFQDTTGKMGCAEHATNNMGF
jgi:hypothetical protein